MTAPDRIWLDWPEANKGDPVFDHPPENATQAAQTPYLRLALLADPIAVHLNMLRGTIAKPTLAQIAHVYGDEWTATIAAARAEGREQGLREAVTRIVVASANANAIRQEAMQRAIDDPAWALAQLTPPKETPDE